MRLVQLLKNILFPEQCVVCNTANVSLCQKCLLNLPYSPHGPHNFIYPLFSYNDERVKKIIYALKYSHTYSLLEHIEKPLEELVENLFEDQIILTKDSCIVIPVPEMKKHTRSRGGNHVALLARRLADSLAIPYVDTAIIRINTTPQRTLSRKERLVNMKNGFKTLDTDKLKNKIIILVDDVVTTGATLDALKEECTKAGATQVYALAITH